MKQILLTIAVCICCLIATSQQLKITPGSFITNNNATITVYNSSIQNDGTISGSGGTIVFTGNNDNTISGNGTTNFHNIQLSKQASSKLILQKNISASGSVAFNSGLIDLANQQFELKYPGGLLQNENENSRIFTAGTGEVFI